MCWTPCPWVTHRVCILVYSRTAWVSSPKLALVSLYHVWEGDCAVEVPVSVPLLTLVLFLNDFILRAWDNKLLFTDICSYSCTVTEYKASDVLRQSRDNGCKCFIWNGVSFFTCSAEKEWAPLYASTFHHPAYLLGVPIAPCISSTLILESQHSSGSNNEHLIIDRNEYLTKVLVFHLVGLIWSSIKEDMRCLWPRNPPPSSQWTLRQSCQRIPSTEG